MSTNLREARMRAREAAVTFLKANDRAGFDRAQADVDKLTEQIRKEETRGLDIASVNYASENRDHAFAFSKWLRGFKLSDAEKRAVESRDLTEGSLTAHIGTYTGLGFFVPTGFSNQLEQATKYFAPLLDTVGRLNTSTGNPLPYPTNNDTSQVAQLVGEGNTNDLGGAVGGVGTTSHVIFGSYKYSSAVIKVSLELIQDSAFDLEAYLAERFGERFGRAYENALTNGSGVSQPTGILTAILASGVTPIIAAGSSESTGGAQTGVNSIGYSDLVNLEHSVDPTYRRRAQYMFHDLTLSAIKRILDKYGRPLWAPGITAGDPDRINGYPYVINQSMPQIGASANTVVFGSLKKYIARKVRGGQTIQRLTERYAELGQVGFLSLDRIDGNLLDAGTHPLNVLQQHS